MVATKRSKDVLSYSTGAEEGVVYRFAAPAIPHRSPTPRGRASSMILEPPDPKRFDWFTAALYVALAVGFLLIAGLSYVIFLSPAPITLP